MTGWPPFAVKTMLRIHFLPQWFSLSDPAMEEALHELPLYCQFARLAPGMSRLPDESTSLRFRDLLEEHGLSLQIMAAINATLANKGLMLKADMVVDATLIATPTSTKNKDGEREPVMYQAKKGNQWHFEMKAHIGVDDESGLVHSVIGTAANVTEVTQGHDLLRGKETVVFADAANQSADKRTEATAVKWQVDMRTSKRRALADSGWAALLEKAQKLKPSVRAKVEHPFRVIKRKFDHVKLRYRDLAKNTAQQVTLFALSNLWIVRKRILQNLQA